MRFEQELTLLRLKVLEMAALVRIAAESSVRALHSGDVELARRIIEGDRIIDDLDLEIDDMCFRLLALAQPWAKDLRFIVAIIRACVHIERCGDEAVVIAAAAAYLSAKEPLPEAFAPALERLGAHAEHSLKMWEWAVDAFRENDVRLAQRVREMECRCDEMDILVLKAFIDAMDRSEKRAVERSVRRLNTARALTRIGKLASNLAEGVLFIVEGKEARHGSSDCPEGSHSTT